MAATFRSASSAFSTLASPLTAIVVTKPAGCVQEDVLIALTQAKTNTTVVTPPDVDWVLIQSADHAGAKVQAWYKIAGPSEPADYTWTFSGAATNNNVGMLCLEDVDNADPIIAAPTPREPFGTSPLSFYCPLLGQLPEGLVIRAATWSAGATFEAESPAVERVEIQGDVSVSGRAMGIWTEVLGADDTRDIVVTDNHGTHDSEIVTAWTIGIRNAPPIVANPTPSSDDLVAGFEPWMTDDLEDYLRALWIPFDQVEELAFDVEGTLAEWDGWTIITDPARAPADALPWLGQFVGQRLPYGLEVFDPDEARSLVTDAPNKRRGSVDSIVRTAQKTLTGSKFVAVYERQPDEDTVTVSTLTSETPSSAKVLYDLRAEAVPADVVLIYSTVTGMTYQALESDTDADTFTEMETSWPDYNAVAADSPQGGVFS